MKDPWQVKGHQRVMAAFMPRAEVSISAAGAKFEVQVASTQAQRRHGLMGRESVPAGTGMAFVFNPPKEAHFWMKDTPHALEMVFVAPGGRIRKIVPHARPDDLTPISTGGPVALALEISADDPAAARLKPGMMAVLRPNGSAQGAWHG